MGGTREWYKATLDGGVPVATGPLPKVALACAPLVRDRRRVWIRHQSQPHVTVSISDQVASATNWFGDTVPNPEWVEQMLRIINA